MVMQLPYQVNPCISKGLYRYKVGMKLALYLFSESQVQNRLVVGIVYDSKSHSETLADISEWYLLV